jgi:hypothetical protein
MPDNKEPTDMRECDPSISGSGPEVAPDRKVKLGVEFNFDKQFVAYSEEEVNGITMFKPKAVEVPMSIILRCAAEIIIKQSAVKVNVGAQVQQPSPGINS